MRDDKSIDVSKLTVNNALETFKIDEDKKVNVALLFYANNEKIELKTLGKEKDIIKTLLFIKKEFINEIVDEAIEKYNKNNNINVN